MLAFRYILAIYIGGRSTHSDGLHSDGLHYVFAMSFGRARKCVEMDFHADFFAFAMLSFER